MSITTAATTPELSVQRLPWAENMVEIDSGATAQQMLTAAGLDWTVEFGDLKREQRVYRHTQMMVQEPYIEPHAVVNEVTDPAEIKRLIEQDPDNLAVTNEWRVAKDVKDVRRTHDNLIFGQVGGDYKLVQNFEALQFADNLIDEGGQWIAAGEQYGGKIVFGVMRLNGDTVTVGGEDAVDMYLVVRTSHNGTTGVQAMVTPIRVQCENMMPLVSRTAKSKWSVRHVSDPLGKIQVARDTLQLARKYIHDGFTREFEELLEVPVSDERAMFALDRVIPKGRSRRDSVIDGIMAAFHNEELNPYRDNGMGLVNGLTDYYDHVINRRTAASRLQEQWDGEGRQMLTKLTAELLHR